MTIKPDVVKEIVKQWDVATASIGQSVSGYRNEVWPVTTTDGEELVLILYKNETHIDQRIRRTNRLGKQLHNKGLPVRRPFSNKIVCNQTVPVRYFSLYYYLPGSTLPWEAYTMNHLKLLGWTMADMHKTMKNNKLIFPNVTDEYRLIIKRMQQYFERSDVSAALKTKLGLIITIEILGINKLLNACDKLPQQILHMDFVRGNLLFASFDPKYTYKLGKYSLSGILDLEKAAYGPVEMDMARTLAFLLVDCKYKSESKIRKYFLESGYKKRGQQTFVADLLLEQLVSLFLLYDFYKFLMHNPYESLEQNEHFERTKLLLIKRGLIATRDAKIGTSNS